MSSAAPRDFRSVAIDQHLTKMFSAIVSGNGFDRADYLVKLERYWSDAVKIGDLYLQGRVQSTRGTLYLTFCELSTAERCYCEARELYTQAGNRDRAFGMENNLGLLEVQRGNYVESVQYFQQSLQLLDDDDPNRPFKMSMVQINLGMALLALFDFQNALSVLEASMVDYADLLEYVRVHSSDSAFIVEQRVFIGMAQYGVGDLENALSSASLAMEFADHTNTVYTRLLALALIIRLSNITSMRLQGVSDVLTQVDEVLALSSGDIYNFCLLREEARYHAAYGSRELARWYGERALNMSITLGSEELRATAQAAFDAAVEG